MNRNLINAPKGVRWPWYPCYRGMAEMTPLPMTEENGEVSWSVEFRYIEKPTKGRVGFKLWWRSFRKHFAAREWVDSE